MAARPPLTVVTSTYNWPTALAQAIRSALGQSFGDFEYLIVGDCCTDETESVVRGFDDRRITWRNLPANTGNQSGVNRIALECARGEYIAYLNHDDLWFPDHLQTLMEPIRENDLDVINSLCLEISPPGHHYRRVLGMPWAVEGGGIDIWPMTTTVIHSAEAARAAGGWVDWRETTNVPTQDFFRRLRCLRNAFGALPHVTALKFHSADRRDCYVLQDASEQERWAALMTSDPQLRYRETMMALACQCLGEVPPKIAQPKAPETAPHGWQIEQWRRMRGLAPLLDLGDSDPGPIAPLPAPAPSHLHFDQHARALITAR